ncbi:glyoxalase [Gluconacetobacter johannae DSM 13595]|uniref:VOC family protein n=1 Tax=Gluconacetobacter johannae TaxID=112140 RepID=A0A7W4P441_9PROT|nr:VOC family protein [Gluconacetobacter johannae]MBB2176712.1 VOC family protein [Gluconacetobacter johannae]GBQ91424.1 glyoxalase [Gluconacetobacter johannae DSM 13595]
MIDHVSIAVTHIPRARAFYDRVLATLGLACTAGDETSYAGYGLEGDAPFFWLVLHDAPVGRTHVAFTADSQAMVQDFHLSALAAGARDHGPPGLRPAYGPDYYAAYILDPDGHNIEAVCRTSGDIP